MLQTNETYTRRDDANVAASGYRTLLVHAGIDAAARRRMGIAAGLGHWFGATVMGVGADPFDPINDPSFGFVDGKTLVEAQQRHAKALELARATFVAANADKTDWRGADAFPTEAILKHARCADLVIASRPGHGAVPSHSIEPANLAMRLGLPLLLLPEKLEELSPRNIIIGWKDSREARRAVSDALPFLQRAERVAISAVLEAGDDEAATVLALDDVAERLLRYGVVAEIDMRPRDKAGVLGALLHSAAIHRADLLVLGAYGHSRAREWLFGGVTEDVLADSPIPVLLSH